MATVQILEDLTKMSRWENCKFMNSILEALRIIADL